MSLNHWGAQSFSPPYTAAGLSSLVSAPPWHYAGWLMNISFAYDAVLADSLVPPALGRATGVGCVHFADWQACSDRDELTDPVYAQYKETIVILQIQKPDGELSSYCPGIWVDQDISLLRGILQGWPKKFGSTWLTRSLPLQHPAAAPLVKGSKLGASLCSKDRRLIEAKAEFTGETGVALGFLQDPVIALVGLPDLSAPTAPVQLKQVRAQIKNITTSGWHQLSAELAFLPHPAEEVSVLSELSVLAASAGWVGLTIGGTCDV